MDTLKTERISPIAYPPASNDLVENLPCQLKEDLTDLTDLTRNPIVAKRNR